MRARNEHALLVRFFKKKEHYDDFINGDVYLSALSSFIDVKDNGTRGDQYEGLEYIEQVKEVAIRNPETGAYEKVSGPTKITKRRDDIDENILCFYLLYPGEDVQEKMRDFGEYSVIVGDFVGFLADLKKEAKRLGRDCWSGAVTYLDYETYSGPVNLFNKSIAYKEQDEFRILIPGGDNKHLTLSLGNQAHRLLAGPTDTLFENWPKHRHLVKVPKSV